jgi:hypothetical protein
MALTSTILAVVALALPISASAKHVHVRKPAALTGSAEHVLGTSAQLTGVINPNGAETSYYFQWGPTTAPAGVYISQTPTVAVGSGTKLKVGQPITGTQPGVSYRFRIVAVYVGSTTPVLGKEHTFTAKGNALRLELTKPAQVHAGTPFLISGTLRGTGGTARQVALQASGYPYLEPFATIGTPATTNAAGAFSFRVTNLAGSTQFRVITIEPRPLYSPVLTVPVAVNVTLHMRSGGAGLVRLYGTVTPAVTGAHVAIQWLKNVRPSKSAEEGEKYVSQFKTVTKRGTKTYSRFSVIVKIRHGGRYRATVEIKPGLHVTGSSPAISLKAAK